MKHISLIIILFVLSFVASAQDVKGTDISKKPLKLGSSVIYTCAMHSEIQSQQPGNCPKCGMKLVIQKPKTMNPKKSAAIKIEGYDMGNMKGMKMPAVPKALPLKKASLFNNKPATKTRGDMEVMSIGVSKMANGPSQPITYTCEMHPEIHSDKPGNCPKCGMRLVKERTEANAGNKAKDDMKMGDMKMPMEGGDEKPSAMSAMKMDGMGSGGNEVLAKINTAKKNLGPIKTITTQTKPHTVRYDLYIRDTTVLFGKKPKRAIAVNGQIPMPTLTFTEGDTAEIWVHNELKEETSLHWHGLFLPNKMDGVPFVTQMPIKPGATYLYKFPIIQHGTHWYHSHSGLQEQIGMYGSFIMNKRQEWDIPTIPVILSEWLDMNPNEANRSLHAASDWFAVQKGATQSYSEAIKLGWFKTKVKNEWKRMTAMDLTDIYYDNFLINGKNQNEQPQFKAGDKVRLRIANGGASDYFWLTYSGGKITVVATDGNDVEPVEVDRLLIAVSETYDVVVTIPENKSYEFLMTPEDRTKYASMWLGSGEKVPAVKLKRPKYFAGMKMMNDMMDMQGNLIPMEGMEMKNQIMDMNTVMYPEITGDEIRGPKMVAKIDKKAIDKKPSKIKKMNSNDNSMSGMNMDNRSADIVSLNYEMLKATEKTTLPVGPVKELYFTLTGNMNRYVWSMDNKVVSEADKILIKKGENIRIILYNNTMMRHPMHLHGHDFRLLNGQGEYAIMKNIIDIMPMERDTIEFAATEPGGDWFFHCHILYHMMGGMGRIFSYTDTLVDKTDITSPNVARRGLNADTRTPHPMARVGLESNGSDGELVFANTRYRLSTEWRIGLNKTMGYETESHFGRYIGRMQWLLPYIGWDFRNREIDPLSKNIFGQRQTLPGKNIFGQTNTKNQRRAVHLGVQYTLPMLITADASIDSDGKYRFQLSREDIPLTPKVRMLWMVNTDKEYVVGFRYILNKYLNLSTHYDSDMGLGAGMTITY